MKKKEEKEIKKNQGYHSETEYPYSGKNHHRNNKTMKISVVIPVFNADKFLRSSVKSALDQKETGEVILVEDNSPDNSLKICRELEEENSRVHLYRHPEGENRGVAASRNLGIKKAVHQWISFLDADDCYLKNRFGHIKQLINIHPEADAFYDAVGFIFESEEKKRGWKEGDLTTVGKNLEPEELFYHILMGKGHFHLDALIIKKELLIKAGMFDENLRVHEDTHLCGKIAALGVLIPGKIDSPIALRRVHEKNLYTGVKENFIHSLVITYKSLFLWVKSKKKMRWKFRKLLLTNYLYIDSMKQASVADRKFYRNIFRIVAKFYRINILGIAFLLGKKF